jgi:tRNA A37 methylthiotransferase MiaB
MQLTYWLELKIKSFIEIKPKPKTQSFLLKLIKQKMKKRRLKHLQKQIEQRQNERDEEFHRILSML